MRTRSIFVSSVMQNYADRRAAARQVLQELGIEAVFAEDFAAGPVHPRAQIMQSIQECDALLGIHGPRYGWDKSQSGLSPTEEEYDYARGLWKPIYAFVDRMEAGAIDARQQKFLEKVQNWDAGVMRNEFRSLAELRDEDPGCTDPVLPVAETSSLRGRLHGSRRPGGLPRDPQTRLPAFDLLLQKQASGTHMTFDPHKLLAVVDGDVHTAEQIQHIVALWKRTLLDYFKPSVWNQTSIEACLAVTVEANPHRLSPAGLPWERSASAGGYYGVLVDLKKCVALHHDIGLKDRGVKTWILEPDREPRPVGVVKEDWTLS